MNVNVPTLINFTVQPDTPTMHFYIFFNKGRPRPASLNDEHTIKTVINT
ncbi:MULTISPECIES: hypothetical protein [Methanohalophilus]|nr:MULTISPECIES: hypothetical protein [Methanohalophilus]